MAQKRQRIERDSLGEVAVPAAALWGAQTQRAVENFDISGQTMPAAFIAALGQIKAAAAEVNAALGVLDQDIAQAIIAAAAQVAAGTLDEQFPVEVFQTGSGTSSNMNANEVIARVASRASRRSIHPNDHVNCSQSSNDVIPTAIHLSAALLLRDELTPALRKLQRAIQRKAAQHAKVVTTGRTHLMDAMPLTLAQEFGGWAAQLGSAQERLDAVRPRLLRIAQGGTAVGTGINAPPQFARRFAAALSRRTRLRLKTADNLFEALSAQDTAVELSGQLRTLACALMKIANDLRWMNSGPLAGIGEVRLPAVQPGSSIMPGKVNPVIPEAVCMAAAQVIGNDAAITVAGQSGNFQLNLMLPLIAHNLLSSMRLLAGACRMLEQRAVRGLAVDRARCAQTLARNPVLATALAPHIGYDAAAKIAQQALREGRPVAEVARERSGLDEATLERLLDPMVLTRGGLAG